MCPRGMSAEPSAAGGQCCKRDSVRVLLSAACDAAVSRKNLGRVFPPRGGASYRWRTPRCGVNRNVIAGDATVSRRKPEARLALRRSAGDAAMSQTKPRARHPAPGGAGYRRGKSRCSAVLNKIAGNAAVVLARPWARFADRRSAGDADSVAKNTLGRVFPPREGPRHPAPGGVSSTTLPSSRRMARGTLAAISPSWVMRMTV